MLDSNNSTNFNKKSHFEAFVYVSYDRHCIVQFISTYDTSIQYETFSTWYNIYCTIHIANRTILTTMYVVRAKNTLTLLGPRPKHDSIITRTRPHASHRPIWTKWSQIAHIPPFPNPYPVNHSPRSSDHAQHYSFSVAR